MAKTFSTFSNCTDIFLHFMLYDGSYLAILSTYCFYSGRVELSSEVALLFAW